MKLLFMDNFKNDFGNNNSLIKMYNHGIEALLKLLLEYLMGIK